MQDHGCEGSMNADPVRRHGELGCRCTAYSTPTESGTALVVQKGETRIDADAARSYRPPAQHAADSRPANHDAADSGPATQDDADSTQNREPTRL